MSELTEAIREYRRASSNWYRASRKMEEAAERLMRAVEPVPAERPANEINKAHVKRVLRANGFDVDP